MDPVRPLIPSERILIIIISVESYCYPNFDSPSVFARILDKDKGGHFSITPTIEFNTKQSYLPSSNVRLFLLRLLILAAKCLVDS